MRYKATPQGQTASYSILLCHQEEKWGTEQKNLYSPQKNFPLLTLPTPECYSIIHQHNRNTEMINVWRLYLQDRKIERSSTAFYTTVFQSTGEETSVPAFSLPLLSNKNRSVRYFFPLYFPKNISPTPFLNRLKKKTKKNKINPS